MDLLGLTDFRVLVVDEHSYDFHFQVALMAPPVQCVHCGQHKLYRHETKPQLFMDLPIRGKRVGITIQRHRYRCCACHHTFFESLPGMNESHFMTNRLISYIQQEALRRTFVSIADEVGLGESTIRALFSEFAATLQPRVPDTKLLYLGIDELYLLHQYRCVITDIQNHQIIDLLRERTKTTVISYLQCLPDTIKEYIAVVCTVISDDGVPSFLASGDAGCVARAQGFPILKSSSVKWRFYAGPHLFEEVFRYLSGVGEGL